MGGAENLAPAPFSEYDIRSAKGSLGRTLLHWDSYWTCQLTQIPRQSHPNGQSFFIEHPSGLFC